LLRCPIVTKPSLPYLVSMGQNSRDAPLRLTKHVPVGMTDGEEVGAGVSSEEEDMAARDVTDRQ
jgi:hypothetical protein